MGISVSCEIEKNPIITNIKEAKRCILNMPQEKYDWVEEYDENDSLNTILECWRYETELTDKGLKIVGFTGSNLGEDDKLWWNLKLVVSDCKLSFSREDGFTNVIEIKNGVYSEDTL